jgi:hypothetical protein
MELALYLSDLSALLDLEQGLRNSDSFDIPQFIFASMFGDDPGAQEYTGNMVAAEWLQNYIAAGHEVTRLYFGQEFCEYLIPSISALEKALAFARGSDFAFTYVTGYVTDAGLANTRRNLEWLANAAPDSEVVANDWGVLSVLAEDFPTLTPVLGRLLIKQQRMARFTTKAPPVNMRGIHAPENAVLSRQFSALRQLNVSIPEYRKRLESLGVKRIDLDIVPQGVDIPPDAWGLGVSCYYPWGYVTGSRNCCTAGMLDPERDFVVTDMPCPAPCRKMNRGARVMHFPQPPVQRGNAVFIYHTQYALPYWKGEVPIDRIVFEPWIPW